MAQITLRDYLRETEDAISAGHVDDAFTHCHNILAQFPQSLEAQRLLGEAYLAQGRLDEAQQSFDWVLTNDPENVVAYCDRALISEGASDYDTALDCYQQAYELSRGNSQIRQEFNRLSAQAGQQGFMFSRAGLARLYMRGDLLTQAIQEWEAVLAVTPDRLDACTGLLETCWREGLYDRVEQLANQVLQDVPTCLKALLLLAYVSSAKNMQQAQELLKRAEALDPDLLMAQELFSDLMARQPAEPFLYLLKKAPAIIDTLLAQSMQARGQETAMPQPAYVPESPLPSEARATWNANTNWNDDAVLVNAMQERQSAQEDAPLPMWPADDNSSNERWNGLEGAQPAQPQPALPDFLNQLGEDAKNTNPWSLLQDPPVAPVEQEEPSSVTQLSEPMMSAHGEDNPSSTNAQAWEDGSLASSYEESAFSDTDGWGNRPTPPVGDSGTWTSSVKEDDPPAWLNMLTQNDKRQLGNEKSAPPPVEAPVEITQRLVQNETPKSAPMPVSDDNEPFSFGPEWLKSLGATSMDSPVADFSPISVAPEEERPLISPPQHSYQVPLIARQEPVPEPAAKPSYEPWNEPVPEPAAEPSYEPWNEPVPEVPDGSERNLLATLEELESDLRSQGFVPLEPNSLSVIAQHQEPVMATPVPTPEPGSHEEDAYQSLPAALVELGGYGQPVLPVAATPTPSASPTLPAPTVLPEEPAWLTSLNAMSASGVSIGSQMQENAPTEVPLSPWQGKSKPLYSPEEEPVREDTFASSRSNATAPSILQPQETTPAHSLGVAARVGAGSPAWQSPVADANALLNSELETTMKRPAVRLQPMPQVRSTPQKDSGPLPGRSRTPEQPPARNVAGGGLNVQERLLKGYQHQLVGDYDEAMQEYRVIIRSSPELLAEVVSNVRALLKIAPHYSTGYRILGDAYMRQGEYLQAMEAYNKALTMAKKAKG